MRVDQAVQRERKLQTSRDAKSLGTFQVRRCKVGPVLGKFVGTQSGVIILSAFVKFSPVTGKQT